MDYGWLCCVLFVVFLFAVGCLVLGLVLLWVLVVQLLVFGLVAGVLLLLLHCLCSDCDLLCCDCLWLLLILIWVVALRWVYVWLCGLLVDLDLVWL